MLEAYKKTISRDRKNPEDKDFKTFIILTQNNKYILI